MQIQDIQPPHEEEKSFQEETAVVMSLEKKSSKGLHFSLRTTVMMTVPVLLFFCILPFTAWGEEGFLQGAIDKVEETITDMTNLLSGKETSTDDNFESLNLENNSQSVASDILTAPSGFGDKLKFEKKNLSNGKEKFAMKSLKGENVEFSDSDETSTEPYLKINKWGDEVSLNIKIPHAANGNKKLKNNRLEIKGNKFQVEVYSKAPEEIIEEIAGEMHAFTINDEGGVEFDIILDSVPVGNVFEFPIETEGLNFYYQPPLDTEHPTWSDADNDGVADRFCPESVVGSYAVYYAAEQGTIKTEEDAEKYRTGKAFHIYRPKISDAAGNEIWGELYFDEVGSIMKVSVDAVWLSAATYPVRIDPNIGFTNVGQYFATYSSGYIQSNPSFTGVAGVVSSISAYVSSSNSGVSKCNIYKDGVLNPPISMSSSGTEQKTATSTLQWLQYNFSSMPTILPTDNYFTTLWLGGSVQVSYDNMALHWAIWDSTSYTSTWSSSLDYEEVLPIFSLYATVESGRFPPGVGVSGGGALFF
ncbi:MAG: hypothetical protein WC180_05840 [Candidatus Paceibacterota bacterium]